jgi:uncharacterized SAM-binding protein YcdF (DUF218 family)
MNWYTTTLISAFLLPPLNLFVLGAAGFALLKSRPRLGKGMVALALVLLYVLSTPFFAGYLLSRFQPSHPLSDGINNAEAIVILGGGVYFDAPEYGGDTVNHFTLERLRYGARLHRKTGKPILVTGGNPGGGTPEANLMRDALETDFKVPVRWLEDQSDNTDQNARFTQRILKEAGISTVYLVTTAWHMPRAQASFERAGLRVVPAPTRFVTSKPERLLDFLPRASALQESYYAMHEAIGLVWYRFKP